MIKTAEAHLDIGPVLDSHPVRVRGVDVELVADGGAAFESTAGTIVIHGATMEEVLMKIEQLKREGKLKAK